MHTGRSDTLGVDMEDEFRRRDIFESLVYRADLSIEAEFHHLDVESLFGKVSQVHWDKAWVSIGLSDTRAVKYGLLFIGLTILMISSYTWAALRSAARASAVIVLLMGLYSVLYSLLQLEDYALLLGTGLMVFVISVLMFVTRNIQGRDIIDP